MRLHSVPERFTPLAYKGQVRSTGKDETSSVPDDQMAFFIRDYYQPIREKMDELAVGKGEGSLECHRRAVEKALKEWRRHGDEC